MLQFSIFPKIFFQEKLGHTVATKCLDAEEREEGDSEGRGKQQKEAIQYRDATGLLVNPT
jgi:hypothetical protein